MCIKLFVKLIYCVLTKIDAVACGYIIQCTDCICNVTSH